MSKPRKPVKKLTNEQKRLAEDNIGLAYSAFLKYRKYFRRIPEDDVRQVCFLGLCKAAQTFDPGRGTKFSTYAFPSIYTTLLQEFVPRGKRIEPTYLEGMVNRKDDNKPIPWEDIIPDDHDIEEDVMTNMLYKQIVQQILSSPKLSEKQKKVIAFHIMHSEFDQRQIAAHLGITQSYVSRILIKGIELCREMVG